MLDFSNNYDDLKKLVIDKIKDETGMFISKNLSN